MDEIVQAFSFAASVASIVLAGFSIWFAKFVHSTSKDSLDKSIAVLNEIKVATARIESNVGVNHGRLMDALIASKRGP